MIVYYIIIAIMAVIIIALSSLLLYKNTKREIKIYFRDIDTNEKIPGDIHVYGNKEIAKINMEEKDPVIKLKRGSNDIRIVSRDYHPKEETISSKTNPVVIQMKKININLTPLPLIGCKTWDGVYLQDGEKANELIINTGGKLPDAAGFFHRGLNILKNKTLALFFYNTAQSSFEDKRLIKMEYNNEIVVLPVNAIITNNDYLMADDAILDKGIEYIIPNDFTGRLNFVFYRADLKDLKIAAFYK